MSDERIDALLQAELDGELTADQAPLLRDALAADRTLRRKRRRLRKVRRLLRELPRDAAPDGLLAETLAAIGADEDRIARTVGDLPRHDAPPQLLGDVLERLATPPTPLRVPRHAGSRAVWATLAIAAAVVLGFGQRLLDPPPAPRDGRALADAAAADGTETVVHPDTDRPRPPRPAGGSDLAEWEREFGDDARPAPAETVPGVDAAVAALAAADREQSPPLSYRLLELRCRDVPETAQRLRVALTLHSVGGLDRAGLPPAGRLLADGSVMFDLDTDADRWLRVLADLGRRERTDPTIVAGAFDHAPIGFLDRHAPETAALAADLRRAADAHPDPSVGSSPGGPDAPDYDRFTEPPGGMANPLPPGTDPLPLPPDMWASKGESPPPEAESAAEEPPADGSRLRWFVHLLPAE